MGLPHQRRLAQRPDRLLDRRGRQGQGFATEAVDLLAKWAFRDRGLHKLWAHVFVTNEGSRRVLEKAGFEREGLLRDQFWVDGEFVDAYTYGLLAEEWRDGE